MMLAYVYASYQLPSSWDMAVWHGLPKGLIRYRTGATENVARKMVYCALFKGLTANRSHRVGLCDADG